MDADATLRTKGAGDVREEVEKAVDLDRKLWEMTGHVEMGLWGG